MADYDRHEKRTGEDEAAFLLRLRRASVRTHVAQLRAIYRLKQGIGDDCGARPYPQDGACDPSENRDELSWMSDLIFDTAKLQLDTYNGMLDIGTTHGDRLMRMFRDRLRARRARPTADRCDVFELIGTAGAWTEIKAFCVVNRLRHTTEVEFRIGEFRDVQGGGSPFQAKAEFHADPPISDPTKERCLAPGASRVFTMRIELNRAFLPGHRYAGILEVCLGGHRMEERAIRITVR